MKYIIVDNQESALYEEVEYMLEQGWELYGFPFSHNGVLVQCLIKKEEVSK